MQFPNNIPELIQKNKNTTVGLIFFVFMGFAFHSTIIQKTDKSKTHPFRIKLYYPRSDGFTQGTPVYIQGMEKGYIQEINIVAADLVSDSRFKEKGKENIIELTIATKEQVPMWNNYRIRYNSVSLFSGRVVDIDPGFYIDEKSSFFNPFYIEGRKIPDFQPVSSYHDNFFTAASIVLEENKKPLRQITRNLKEVTMKLNSSSFQGTLPKLIQSGETWDNLDNTVVSASIILQEFRWYEESYEFMYNTPSTLMINIYTNNSAFGRIYNQVYNQSTPVENLVK